MSKLTEFFEKYAKDPERQKQKNELVEKNKSHKLKKKHADPLQPLKDDPALKQLTLEREAAIKELSELNSEEDREQYSKAEKKLEGLDLQIEALTKKFIQQGIVPKALGDEYLRENEELGWRHHGNEEPTPSMPNDWADNYQEDPESGHSIRGEDLAEQWGMKNDLEKAHKHWHALIQKKKKEKENAIPPMPNDWADNYQEDPESGHSIRGEDLAEQWGMKSNLDQAYQLWAKKMKEKGKMKV